MSEAEGAVVVRIDAGAADVEEPSSVAEQIPEAGTLAPGTRVEVPAKGTRKGGGVLGRVLGERTVPVGKAARCTALLVRGYVEIGADGDKAWGKTPAG